MRKFLITVLMGCLLNVAGQNKQVLYGFDKIPQGLLLNPGAERSYKYHIGVPMLSGLSASANTSGVTLADVFRDDSVGRFSSTDFNTRFRQAISQLGNDDYGYANAQIEVVNAGFKINKRDYLSAGFYTELDAFVTYPKDMFTLMNEGNLAYLNRSFSFSQAKVKAEVLGVLHVGVSRTYNNRFTAGARLKIYSGSLNVTSTGNTGTFTTRETVNNIYENVLNNVDAEVNSSGIYDENNDSDITFGSAFGGSFFSGNFGVGFDVGFTYYLDKQTEVTASLLDIGFVNYSKDTRNAKIEGSYTFSGVDFQYDETQNIDYWTQLDADFNANLPREENRDSYTVMRPIKLNSSFTHRFGQSRNLANCHDITNKDFYDNAVGGQLYADFRPTGLRYALTGFYERKFSKYLNTKVTYTIDDFSYTNFGIGISANIWRFNIYGMADNIFELTDIADSNRASFQLGINYIVN